MIPETGMIVITDAWQLHGNGRGYIGIVDALSFQCLLQLVLQLY